MAKESLESKRKRMRATVKGLKKQYPDSKCALHYKSPFQLLCATILSAQCTDKRVNMVTPNLFKKFPDAKSMSKARLSVLEEIVRTTGFFKNKAKSLSEMSKSVMEQHSGQIPRTMDELVHLRGVGRKTANVLLGNAFDINEGVVVDTHVGRLTRRMGFTKEKDPVKVERELVAITPKKDWTILSHLLIDHGRAICDARKPKCADCFLASKCPRVGVV